MRSLATRWARWSMVLLVAVAAGCSSAGGPGLGNLAEEPPLPYSVLVTGGAFPEFAAGGAGPAPPLHRTFRPAGPLDEPFGLDAVIDVLRRGRVFVAAAADPGPSAARKRIAAAGSLVAGDRQLGEFLRRARLQGHDLLLVIERLQDQFIEYRGINGQWPVTLAVWFLVGLGLVIPDHTYESHASLVVSLRDVRTGRLIDRRVLDGGTVELSLIERTDWLGLLTSVVVPPFWVGDDDEEVEATVRRVSATRLLEALARQLKSADARAALRQAAPVSLRVDVRGRVAEVRIEGAESVSFARARIDTVPLEGPAFDTFQRALLASIEEKGDGYAYHAELPLPAGGDRLQLLVQTVAGGVASITVELP